MAQPGPTRIAVGGRSISFIRGCCRRAANEFGIANFEVVGQRDLPSDPLSQGTKQERKFKRRVAVLTQELIDRVDAALPPQPWKPGVHNAVAAQLGYKRIDVAAAINRLVELGRRHQQRDGVVYARDGTVLMIDDERVSASDKG